MADPQAQGNRRLDSPRPRPGGEFMNAQKRELFLLSFLMLFVELSLIRWLGENILYLSFFTNFVLLASFLGIGVGFLMANRDIDLFRWFPYSLLGLIGAVIVFPVHIDRRADEVLFLGTGNPAGLPIWLALPLVFIAVAAVLAMVGQATGIAFSRFEPLVAYRLDILGSLSGVVAFAALSLLGVPPVGWAAVVALLVFFTARDRLQAKQVIALLGVALILGAQSLRPGSLWSPYYRIDMFEVDDSKYLNVNGIPHQVMLSVEQQTQPLPELPGPLGWLTTWPYLVIRGDAIPSSVLVIGAGSGNDVAFALSTGAERVDAVEIDPRIHDLGSRFHPDAPYSDPRVMSIIDDGRAFLENTNSTYDLVVFALTDSLTLVSGQSSLRLESYLYTREAFAAARRILTDNGSFAIYNTHPDNFVVQRMARTMAEVFGSQVCGVATSDGRPGTALVAGPGTTTDCSGGETVDLSDAPLPVTDDRPFLYVAGTGIPTLYVVVLTGIMIMSFAAVRGLGVKRGQIRPYFDLFLMGAAFLLLETKSIVQFALWFGTTWRVNVLVFTAVLVTVLAAIETAQRFSIPTMPLYAALFLSLAIGWAIPPATLLTLAPVLRWVAASAITFSPVFFANLVFSTRFKEAATSTVAFGVNLLGAMVGGVLEYASLAVGYRSLVVIAALLYGGAFLTLSSRRAAPST
jgi:SAM-dependent methyltransferase